MPLLFSYGTLQDEAVQLQLFGRRLHGKADQLLGFEQSVLKIDDPDFEKTSGTAHHAVVRFTGDDEQQVNGTVFEVSESELAKADRYEPAGYQRVMGKLASGRDTWVYAASPRQMPTFGRSMLEHWLLDPACTYLNHGTVGAPPKRVLARQQALRDEMERQPSRFMLRELNGEQPMPWRGQSRLREAIGQIAPFVGARPEDLVFVPNVTTGLNAVLRSLPLGPGDELVITDLAYGAVALAARVVTGDRGAVLRTVETPSDVRDASDLVDPIVRALTPRTKLVVVDHIAAQTAWVLPVAAITAACHAHGVPVLIDGAHAPGAIALDIPATGADWYSANLHKWGHAPRSCGILWAKPEHQPTLRHPIVSWGSARGFLAEFENHATSDPTACLASPEGIALLREWDFAAVLAYMHGLAREAARVLTGRWGTRLAAADDMFGAMVTVPLPEAAGSTADAANRLRLALLVDERIEVPIHASRGRLWTRVSAQIYNDGSDIERLAEAVGKVVKC
jgi:isopenicillin-N epimerase